MANIVKQSEFSHAVTPGTELDIIDWMKSKYQFQDRVRWSALSAILFQNDSYLQIAFLRHTEILLIPTSFKFSPSFLAVVEISLNLEATTK